MPGDRSEATPVLAIGSGRDGGLDAALARLVAADREAVANRPDTPDGYVTAVRRLPPVAATYAPIPAGVDPRLCGALNARGITQLYTHQAEAVEHVLGGRHVVVVTPTASGKTLCYNAPVLSAILQDPSSRALYLFPTKALAQDQLAELHGLAETLAAREEQEIGVFTYDGDTPQDARRAVRTRAHVVLTNADMLHAGILPHHPRWAKLFENLRYVVIDELHAYRGVFGSHLCNVIRRLDRICRHYGSNPVFVCSSATIANPRELAERLTGRPFELVERSGAPRGEKFFVFVNPPVVNRQLGIRRSYLNETRRVTAEFLRRNLQLIVFAQSRLTTEILTTYLKDDFEGSPGTPERIRGYRGGYLPNRRREIERGLRDGVVRAVVSTNALELGIDIGALDVAVLAGYPGTIAATWQRAGRAGRRSSRSAAVMVASSAPLDQFMVRNPSYFFEASPERALIDPDNLHILVDHVKCAAFELPFTGDETFGRHDVQQVLAILAEQGLVHASPGADESHLDESGGPAPHGLPEGESPDSNPRDAVAAGLVSGGGAPQRLPEAERDRASAEGRDSSRDKASGGGPPSPKAPASVAEASAGKAPQGLPEGESPDSNPRDADAAGLVSGGAAPQRLPEAERDRASAEGRDSSRDKASGGGAPQRLPEAERDRASAEGRDSSRDKASGGGAPRAVKKWTWTSESYPADAVSLRSVTSDNFVVVDETHEPRVIGETDFTSGPPTLHPKAIYMVEGRLFQVERLDFDGRKAFVRVIDCDYYTDAITYSRVTILDTFNENALASNGEVHAVSRVVGFKKIKFYTNENVGSGELDLPEQQMHTTAYWLTLPSSLIGALPFAADDRRDGVLGLAYAMRQIAQLLLMCDRQDIGLSIDTGESAVHGAKGSMDVTLASDANPRIFIYDNYPGGIGFSEPLYRMHAELLGATHRLISECPCEQGCPACVGPAGATGPLAKVAAQRILDLIMAT